MQNATKPPRTPNKYTMAAYRQDLMGKVAKQRDDLNMSVDIYHNHTMDDAVPYEQDEGQDEMALQ